MRSWKATSVFVAVCIAVSACAAECKPKPSARQRLEASALDAAILDLLTNEDLSGWREWYTGLNPKSIGLIVTKRVEWYRPAVRGFTFEEYKQPKTDGPYMVIAPTFDKIPASFLSDTESEEAIVIHVYGRGTPSVLGGGVMYYKVIRGQGTWSAELLFGDD